MAYNQRISNLGAPHSVKISSDSLVETGRNNSTKSKITIAPAGCFPKLLNWYLLDQQSCRICLKACQHATLKECQKYIIYDGPPQLLLLMSFVDHSLVLTLAVNSPDCQRMDSRGNWNLPAWFTGLIVPLWLCLQGWLIIVGMGFDQLVIIVFHETLAIRSFIAGARVSC